MKRNSPYGGFTFVEMIVSVTLFALTLVLAFDTFGNIGVSRHTVASRAEINQDVYETIETLFVLIKEGGGIDYEEYWNRRAVGYTLDAGHYRDQTGYGNYGSGGIPGTSNYGDWYYYCASGTGGTLMGTDGCLNAGEPQRYGQYAYQFIDYNSNADDDTADCLLAGLPNIEPGDEDCSGSIRFDDDDETLAQGPEVFSGSTALKELYLIKTEPRYERVYFRHIYRQDPAVAGNPSFPCDTATGSGAGCIGNIQILRMTGHDLGKTHSAAWQAVGLYDGLIDTWQCHPDFACANPANVAMGMDTEWVDLFPDTINVSDIAFYITPNKNYEYAWRENTQDIKSSEQVRISMTIGHSWANRQQIQTTNPNITITTTINLTP